MCKRNVKEKIFLIYKKLRLNYKNLCLEISQGLTTFNLNKIVDVLNLYMQDRPSKNRCVCNNFVYEKKCSNTSILVFVVGSVLNLKVKRDNSLPNVR